MHIASIQNLCTQHQPKNNLHSINPITIYTASDFLSVGFTSPKTYTLPSTPHHPVILRGAEGEVAESIIQKITLSFRERGGHRRWWVRAGQEHFFTPLIRPGGHLLPREKVILR